jgi:acyl transferase domain-containing protein
MTDVSTIPSSPVAVVGIGAIMPEAPDAAAFWSNITGGRYSITDVPAERWARDLYFSADHAAPDKTYSTIGGWVRDAPWDPIAWKLPIPPKVADQMDDGQRWAISTARAALVDAGWPDWNVDPDNVAVIIGNAIGGEKHYKTNMRIELPEVLRDLETTPTFAALSPEQREHIVGETRAAFLAHCGEINEDTMPGELANVIAGRVANLFNFRGPNFTTDAACASGLAAMSAAVEGLVDHRFDAAVTGGIDHNMGVAAFVKFCKIGALSATGTRPFDAGADGFVMGEGAALFVLKRLEDAERDGDRVYAVILGIAGSSDGKGKGITAPNPVGQKLAVSRAWDIAGLDPATVSAIEAHGTSTRVGDATELASLDAVFGAAGAPVRGIALGSVKSNIGHLKAAAGSAGVFKMVRSLHDKVLAPSLNFRDPNPNVDWDRVPFAVNTELRDWATPPCGIRRAGVSAFGFGGTNFHVVLEEHVPGRHKPAPRSFATAERPATSAPSDQGPGGSGAARATIADPAKPPLRGALVLGGSDDGDLLAQLDRARTDAHAGRAPAPTRPDPAVGSKPVRIAIDFADAAELAGKLDKAITAISTGNDALFRMLRQQGVFVGRGAAPKVAFLYTGQGSQYVNMLAGLQAAEPIVADVFRQADEVMTPLLGRPLTSFIFIDGDDPQAVTELEQQLLQTEITQPAVLATDQGISQLLAAYGMRPDMVMGHSLGEYGALVAAGSLTFDAALEAVSARGREMAALSVEDNGAMAAVFGPLPEIERIVAETPGYVVVANINSNNQAVVGGATAAVTQAVEQFSAMGMQAMRIPGEPRLPHVDRRAGLGATGGDAAPSRRPTAQGPDRGQRDGRVLSVRRDQRDDARLPRPAGVVARAVRAGLAHAVRGRCPGLRRGGAEARTARLRRRRPRRPRRRARAVHEPSEARRSGLAEPGPVRAVGVRRRVRPAGGGSAGGGSPRRSGSHRSGARRNGRCARGRSHHAARSVVRRGHRAGAAHLWRRLQRDTDRRTCLHRRR